MLPTYIGIGAPKSATTWISKCLKEHPNIFMAPKKETYFFDYDRIEGRLDEYERHFERSEGEEAVGEVSTRYLASEQAPSRIRRLIPEVRLFVSLRDPLEQVQSHYWHLHRQNFHQWDRDNVPDSFGEALCRYEDKLLDPVRYYTHLQRWLQYFDRSQILILFYDDIQSRPGVVLRRLYEHVGVDADFEPDGLRQQDSSTRKGVAPRGQTFDQIRRILYDVLNRKVYYPLKNTIGVNNAHKIKEFIGARRLIEAVFMKKGYPEISKKNKVYIKKEVLGEIEKIRKMTERELSEWLEV